MHYVLSDIHGNKRRFDSVMKQISLQPEDTLYVLGDVIDRHPDGIDLLFQLKNMPNVKMCMGNHEYMMIQALRKNAGMYQWTVRNFGHVTYEAYKKLSYERRQELLDFLENLPLSFDLTVNEKKYKLVHASPKEFYLRDIFDSFYYYNATEYAVWHRFRKFPEPVDYTLVFGHTITNHFQKRNPNEVYFGEQMIGIDCGCGCPESSIKHPNANEGGRLACLRLEDMQVVYSEEF